MSRFLIGIAIVAGLAIAVALAMRATGGRGLAEPPPTGERHPIARAAAPSGERTMACRRPATQASRPAGSPPTPSATSRTGTTMTTQPPPAADPTATAVAATVADAVKPYAERAALVESLGRQADAPAVEALAAVAAGANPLRQQAMAALGATGNAAAAPVAARYTTDGDPQVAAAAVRALAKTKGAAAVPEIAAALLANRKRVDGQEDLICRTCVEALTELATPTALPALRRELEEVAGIQQNHDYGSAVVRGIQASRDRAGAAALRAYAERLRREREAKSDNPMGQHYLDRKIAEAEAAARALEGHA